MKKNKKNYNKILGIFFLMIICLSFFPNKTIAIGTYEYQNADGKQTTICGFSDKDSCGVALKNKCGNDIGTVLFCKENIFGGCSNPVEPICPVVKDVQNFDPQKNTTTKNNIYTLLAPIGKLVEAPDNIGDYFNTIFLIAIGLCGALAVIMIVIGGIQYMGDESIFGKTEAKSKITSAVLGLLIALGSYALLNTINPDLLGKRGVNIKQVSAEIIDLPDAGDSTIDPSFGKEVGSYSTGSISPGTTSVIDKLQQGWTISELKVSSINNTMSINIKKGASVDTSNVISIGSGGNGYSTIGQGQIGDRKTPKGTWIILSMTTPGNGIPVYNSKGSNMGASFWLLNPTTNGERGIGIHGNKSGTITDTAGCIRLKNADILALLPYIKSGIPVIIN